MLVSMPVCAIPIAKRLLDFESGDGELFVCLVLPRPTFPTCLDPSCKKCKNGHFPKLGVPSWGFHIKDDDILRSVLGSRHPFCSFSHIRARIAARLPYSYRQDEDNTLFLHRDGGFSIWRFPEIRVFWAGVPR